MTKKKTPVWGRRGQHGRELGAILIPPSYLHDNISNAQCQISRLLDQAVAQAEHCEARAAHYGQLAQRHRNIKAELERLVIPTALPDGMTLLEWAGLVVEEVWNDD